MRTILHLTLVTFLCLQTAISQEINYKEVTQIIVGEYHTEQDVQIIKEEIVNNNKQNIALKLLDMNGYLNTTVDIDGKEINKACSDSYIAKEKNKVIAKKLYQEVQQLIKKNKEVSFSNYEITKLNKKIKKSNELNEQQNEAVDNYKMCLTTQKAIREDYREIIDDLYKAFTIRKTKALANND